MNIVNALTIDVEDYFHVANFASFIPMQNWHSFPLRVDNNVDSLLDLFAEHRIQATFFILGWVAEKFPGMVRNIHKQGHEIACHGYNHQLIYQQTSEEFRQDIYRSKCLLEDLCGERILGYRAPSYSITSNSLWAIDMLIGEGFQYDSSIFPIHHPRYGIPNAQRYQYTLQHHNGVLEEFPPTTIAWGKFNIPVAGGGYFRLFPYIFTHWSIKNVNSSGEPFIFYLHPWEIDPQQPRFGKASFLSSFRHYVNLHSTKGKLRQLLTDFSFTTIRNLLFTKEREKTCE